jgi:hypothetical protein
MNLKRFLLVLTSMALLAGIAANSASAAAVTKPSRWYVNGVGQNAGQVGTVKCNVEEETEIGKKLVLEGTVGEGAGIKVTLTATGIECINHEGTPGANGTATLNQTGKGTVAEPYVAEDLGRLKFTGVTVSTPPNCAVKGGTVTTNPLKSELYMDSADNTVTFDEFKPTGTSFATVPVVSVPEGSGTCSVEGERIAKGFTYGQAVNKTGVEAVKQHLTFGTSVETTAGNGLTFAGNPAHLKGTVNNELTSGLKYGSKES